MKTMTPAERAITALNGGIPDEVPTFELEFQLPEEFFGISFNDPRFEHLNTLSKGEIERAAIDLADKYARVYTTANAYDIGGAALSGNPEFDSKPGLDYCIIPAYNPFWNDPTHPVTTAFRKRLREYIGDTRLLGCHGDGTYAIPDGDGMYEFAYRLYDEPEDVLAVAKKMAEEAMEANKRQKEAGIDVSLLCSDYCYNSGPFISPEMFDEFIAPFLAQIIQSGRENGLYMIKHTDGNIMPILKTLVECHPHALHSIDPMAGVDIKEVKRLYGKQVALCGNVHCAALQTGTDAEVEASARYCLTHGKEGGGYIFATSNIPFKGMPARRYQMILDIWKEMRKY